MSWALRSSFGLPPSVRSTRTARTHALLRPGRDRLKSHRKHCWSRRRRHSIGRRVQTFDRGCHRFRRTRRCTTTDEQTRPGPAHDARRIYNVYPICVAYTRHRLKIYTDDANSIYARREKNRTVATATTTTHSTSTEGWSITAAAVADSGGTCVSAGTAGRRRSRWGKWPVTGARSTAIYSARSAICWGPTAENS